MQQRQIPQRLKANLNISLAQSSVIFDEPSIIHNHSIIHELQDFQFENQKPRPKLSSKIKRNTLNIKEDIKDSQKKIQELIGSKTIAKLNKVNFIPTQNHSTLKNSSNEPFLQKATIPASPKRTKFLSDQENFFVKKIKEEQDKSTIVRLKEFILNQIFPKCQLCESVMSFINEKGNICCECSEDESIFPLLGVLYELQNPTEDEDLDEVLKQVETELKILQKLKNELDTFKEQLIKIIELKTSKGDGEKKLIVKRIANLRKDIRMNKNIYKSKNQIEAIIAQNYEKEFDQFSLWDSLKLSESPLFQGLRKSIDDYKPLCLKEPNSSILPFLNNVTNNFNHTHLRLSISDRIPLGFNFSGVIKHLTIVVDGSFLLSRQNFLLVDKIEHLKIEFKQKKTSRELKQLFYMLPRSNSLVFQFDYRNNSHISSQTFPILCRSFERQGQYLQVYIKNARQQIVKELLIASKSLQIKKKLVIHIEMNPYIEIKPIYEKEYGSNIVYNIIKNLGEKINHLSLKLPIQIDYEGIYEQIINSQFLRLTHLKIQGTNQMQGNGLMTKLCKEIVMKKNHFLGLLNKNTNQTKIKHFQKIGNITKKCILNMLIV